MRHSLAAALAALVLMLPAVGTAPAQAAPPAAANKHAKHKHFKLLVSKKGKKYHVAHTFKDAKAAHRAAHKYHKRGYKTRIRAV